MKVYCKYCRNRGSDGSCICLETRIEKKDNWYEQKDEIVITKEKFYNSSIRNAKNDCPEFIPHWYCFGIKRQMKKENKKGR